MIMKNTEKTSRREISATSSPSLGHLSINDGQDSKSNIEAKAGLMDVVVRKEVGTFR